MEVMDRMTYSRRRESRQDEKKSISCYARMFIFDKYLRLKDWDDKSSVLLLYWRGDFYRYEEGYYRLISREELEDELISYLKNPDFPNQPWEDVTQSDLNNILLHVRHAPGVFVPDWKEMPCWVVPERYRSVREPVFTLRNGLLSLDDLMEGKEDPLQSWTPRWFSTIRLEYDYAPQASCPLWLRFLEEVLEGDRQRIRLLQMWFGYCLLPMTEQHKFLLAVGEGANGKSVVFEVMGELLGQANVSHVPLECFGERFALEATVGKLANIVSEIGEMDKVAEGRLKEFVAADRMNLQRKYRDSVNIRPTARLMLATNTLPRFADRSQGLWRRMILLPFNYSVPPERQDKLLAWQICKDELAGVFVWALDGLMSFLRAGAFVEPDICKAALDEYRIDCDPPGQFLKENYEVSPLGAIGTRELYNHYSLWCQENGYRALNSRNFGKALKKTFPKVERGYYGNVNNRVRVYSGIRLIGEESNLP